MIASSVAEEEPALLDMVATLVALPRPPRVIWAPRSPQRFDAVAGALSARGLSPARRSGLTLSDAPTDTPVLLGDSLGEMATWYSAADLVFVGASLVDHGGHNIVEPLAQGRPVIMGPSTWGIAFPAEQARAAGALVTAPDAQALAATAEHLLTTPAALARLARAANGFSESHLGAARRSADALSALVPGRAD